MIPDRQLTARGIRHAHEAPGALHAALEPAPRNQRLLEPVYRPVPASRFITSTAAALALVISSACVVSVDSHAVTDREEKRFSVDGTPEVTLTTFDGSVEIRSWDKAEVVIEVEKRGASREAIDAIRIDSSQSGRRIRLEARVPEDGTVFGIHKARSARLVASVPREAHLVVRSGDGSITVERVRGRVELRTDDGTIRVSDVRGELFCDTADGSVRLEGIAGRLRVETSDGGISASGALEAVDLRTADGSIALRVDPEARMSDDWSISTADGGVVVYLPAALDADLDVETGDGVVRADDELGMNLEGRDPRRRSLRSRMGSGGRQLRIRSNDGSISLRAAP